MNEQAGLIPVKHVSVPTPSYCLRSSVPVCNVHLSSVAGKMTVMKNIRQVLSYFTNTKPMKIDCASSVKGVVTFDKDDPVVLPLPKRISFAFVELLCLVPNFRGSALSSQPRAQGLPWQPESLWQLEQLYCKDPWLWRSRLSAQPSSALRLAKSVLPRDVAQGWGPRLHH